MDISHEEFVTILKEKNKNEKMKDNLRSKNEEYKITPLSSMKSKIKVKNYWVFYVTKNKNFFFCMYKIVDITKETLENIDIEVIIHGVNTLWLNERHIEEKLVHKSLPAITNKYDKKYKKHRYELVDEPIKQPNRRFLRIDLALKLIMDCRTDESCSLKRNLGFKLHDVTNTKKQAVINSIKDAFEGEDMQTQ